MPVQREVAKNTVESKSAALGRLERRERCVCTLARVKTRNNRELDVAIERGGGGGAERKIVRVGEQVTTKMKEQTVQRLILSSVQTEGLWQILCLFCKYATKHIAARIYATEE